MENLKIFIRKLLALMVKAFFAGVFFAFGLELIYSIKSYIKLEEYYRERFKSSEIYEEVTSPENIEFSNIQAKLNDNNLIVSGVLLNNSDYEWRYPYVVLSIYVDALRLKQCTSYLNTFEVKAKENAYIEISCSGFYGDKIPDSFKYDLKIDKAFKKK